MPIFSQKQPQNRQKYAFFAIFFKNALLGCKGGKIPLRGVNCQKIDKFCD